MRAKSHAGTARQRGGGASTDDNVAVLVRNIRGALENYLDGRRLARVQIRRVEGSKTEGFLKIEGRKGERLLVDFSAFSTPQGELSSLEVGDKKISVVVGATTRGARD